MKVTAIMPTRERPEMAAAALDCFLSQAWGDTEIIVIDDEDAPSFPDGISLPPGICTYIRQSRAAIGKKRNQACELSSGELICHWDDDDYSAPGRIADQVSRILATGAPVTGYNSMEFRDGADRYLYTGSERYALGTSLMYRNWYWERVKFVEIQYLPDGGLVAEDNMFVAKSTHCITTAPAGDLMWARIHPGNTSGHKGKGSCWQKL